MKLPDVNILLHAFRADSSEHGLCRAWLDRAVLGEETFAVSRLVLSAVIRISTSPKVFKTPSTLDEAFGFCSDIVDQPHCRLVEPGNRHWSIFERLCQQTATRGPRITDAWFAALTIEHGCTWITLDRDFARFPGLTWSAP